MSDFEDRLNEILSDPARMDMITSMAKSFMSAQEAPQADSAATSKREQAHTESLDGAMVGRLAKLMGGGGKGTDSKRALLEAIKPYLSPARRDRLERAMKLAKMIGMAELAFEVMGGEDAQI